MEKTIPLSTDSGLSGFKWHHRYAMMMIACGLCWAGSFSVSARAESRHLVKPVFKIGYVLPLTGGMSKFGQEVKRGVEVALDKVKAEDPDLYGRLTVIYANSASSAKLTADVARDLTQKERVHALAGGVTRITASSLSRAGEELDRPVYTLMNPAGQADHTSAVDATSSCFFSVDQGKQLAHFAKEDLKFKTAVAVTDGGVYAEDITESFSTHFARLGGRVLARVNLDRDPAKLEAFLRNLKSLAPDAVLLPLHYKKARDIVEASRKLGLPSVFVGSDSWDASGFYDESTSKIMHGSYYFTNFSFQDPTPSVQAFDQAFFKAHQRHPSVFAALGYDSLVSLVNSFKDANSNRAKIVKKALQKAKCSGFIASDTRSELTLPTAMITTSKDGLHFVKRLKF